MQDIGARYQRQGFSQQADDLILASWRPATQAAYKRYIAKWKSYALRNKVAVNSPSTIEVANFIAELFRCGASHSAINSARSALSAYLPLRDGFSVGSHPDTCSLVKGAFEERPSMPKYSSTWDVKTVRLLRCIVSYGESDFERTDTENMHAAFISYRSKGSRPLLPQCE